MAERVRVGVLISGRGSNMAALIYAAQAEDCPYDIALVIANDPNAPGLALARAEGVASFAHSHKGLQRADFEAIIERELTAAGCAYVALAGYMRLLSDAFVARWAGRIINIHPSLLPLYKGLDTHARALAAGDSHAGCSVHIVTTELDDGPVLGQTRVAILPGDTAQSLAARVLIAEHQLYPQTLARFVSQSRDPAFLTQQVRACALSLPETQETLSHGMVAFRITGGKMFAYVSHNHHGDGMTALIVKTSGSEEQAMLIEMDPERYFRPAYFGPSGWIGLRLDKGKAGVSEVDWDMVTARVQQSWRLVAPRKLAALLEWI